MSSSQIVRLLENTFYYHGPNNATVLIYVSSHHLISDGCLLYHFNLNMPHIDGFFFTPISIKNSITSTNTQVNNTY